MDFIFKTITDHNNINGGDRIFAVNKNITLFSITRPVAIKEIKTYTRTHYVMSRQNEKIKQSTRVCEIYFTNRFVQDNCFISMLYEPEISGELVKLRINLYPYGTLRDANKYIINTVNSVWITIEQAVQFIRNIGDIENEEYTYPEKDFNWPSLDDLIL